MLHSLYAFMELAERVIPSKPAVDVLQNVCVKDGFLLATDLNTFVRMPVSCTENFLLPARLLKKVLTHKPRQLKVAVSGERVSVSYDKQKLSFPAADVQEFPAFPSETFKHAAMWQPDIFKQLAAMTVFASTDPYRPALNSVCVMQDETLSAVATSGHILQWQKNLDPACTCDLKTAFTVLIPALAVKQIHKAVHSRVYISLSENFLHLQLAGNLEVAVRLVKEEYVAFERVIPKQFTQRLVLERDLLSGSVKKLKAMAPLISSRCSLTVGKNMLLCALSDLTNSIEYSVEMPVESDVSFSTNLDLSLLDTVIHTLPRGEISWQFSAAEQPSLFCAADTLNLIMPIRMEKNL
ncbi:MAG: hypothetical protein H6627_10830 [Calditrichae bacterium]|nr:hypothetical protein [Calditrichia bacterium]